MAKYSTNRGGGDGGGESCELCGKTTTSLRQANVAGARLLVCSDCAPHDDAGGKKRNRGGADGGGSSGPVSRKKRAAQRAAKLYDQQKGDPTRWEKEGTNYERDRLPYLVSDYGDRLAAARQEAGLELSDLAADLDVDETTLRAVEQGRATRAGVGGSLIRALEERLDVQLVDE